MARFGGRRSKYSRRGKYGRKYRRYGKMRYKKYRSSKAKLYRQGGNYAASSGKPTVELKSFDNLYYNTAPPSNTPAAGSFGEMQKLAAWSKAVCDNWAAQFNPPITALYGFALVGSAASLVALPLNSMGIGSALNQRIGRKVTMRSIKIDILLRAPSNAAPTANQSVVTTTTPSNASFPAIRLMLVYDRQTNNANVQYSDVLAAVGNSGLTGTSTGIGVCSSNNLNNRSRFLTLMDKTYVFGSADIPYRKVSIYKKMNLPVIYNSNTAGNPWDIAVIQTGGLFLLAVSDSVQAYDPTTVAAAAFNSPWAHLPSYRLRFTDA